MKRFLAALMVAALATILTAGAAMAGPNDPIIHSMGR